MNKLTKTIAVIGASLAMSFSVHADNFDRTIEWYSSDLGNYHVQEMNNGLLYATLYKTVNGGVNVGFDELGSECTGFSNDTTPVAPHLIEGTWVKMSTQCISEGVIRFFPTTIGGGAYLVDKFKTLKQVSIRSSVEHEPYVFSAMGFTKAYTIVKMDTDRNAI